MTTVQDDLDARDNLVYIAQRWPDLKARLRREGGSPLTGRTSGSHEQPLVIDIHISDLLHEIETETRSLAHVLCDETVDADGRPWAPRTSVMPHLLTEVAEHFGHWTTADERTALAFCDWAHEYSEKVRRALERPAPPTYMGDCPLKVVTPLSWDGEDYLAGDPCPGSLYLRPGRTTMSCPACRGETTLEAQRDHVRAELEKMLMTQTEIRAALVVLGHTVPLKTVQSWTQELKSRPPRLPEAYPESGLYRLREALDLAERWGARRAG
ncbi:hypothetical protein EDD28_2409 [Salana multivorans]|uniref:Uncharacterized protein n=1 Tax=Salana multivorans TaxID=120377 RepID=A0A3N2DDD5_9MICO|nr:hypothetical protein [Salana multivorans]ROR97801.1 hypothetical protein EDD28_2409 [Salana multivorans]